MMMDMTTMSTGMMLGMGIYHLIIVFADKRDQHPRAKRGC
jgi:lipid-binding SYLF domain-containing protein